LALNALALALLRRYDEALAACEQALHVSASIETRVPVEGVRAVVALSSGSGTDQVAREAFRTALEFGNIDSLTTVYRGYPALLPAIAADHDLEAPLWTLLARAHDVGLARQAGLQPSKPTLGHWQLTKREEEVLTLLAQGLTNKKIAERLFLAEVTVKVHVRHIFEKLGVRSRTEAAVRATIANTGPD
jgi:DNA-binding CsgD family transcriptional regulator